MTATRRRRRKSPRIGPKTPLKRAESGTFWHVLARFEQDLLLHHANWIIREHADASNPGGKLEQLQQMRSAVLSKSEALQAEIAKRSSWGLGPI